MTESTIKIPYEEYKHLNDTITQKDEEIAGLNATISFLNDRIDNYKDAFDFIHKVNFLARIFNWKNTLEDVDDLVLKGSLSK